MTTTELNNKINLRAMLIDAETQRSYRAYGKNSATAKGRYFKENIGLFVSYALKNI